MTCSQREEFNPQYQSDIDGLAGEPDSHWEKHELQDSGSPLGLHDETLYDQDETELGSHLINLATGKKIDNSTEEKIEGLNPIGAMDFDTDDDLAEALRDENGEVDLDMYFHIRTIRETLEDKRKQN